MKIIFWQLDAIFDSKADHITFIQQESYLSIRVSSIGRDFIVLLKQCRHMNPDEL